MHPAQPDVADRQDPTPAPAYAIYTRQSRAKPNDPFSSCKAQFAACRNLAVQRYGSAWRWIGEPLDDEGISGATTDRPAFERLQHLIRIGSVQAVIVYSLDRVARTMRACMAFLDLLRERQVQLLLVRAPDLGQSATDNFLLNLMGIVAEFEHDLIRSRLADNRAARKRKGLRLSGPPPFGYDVDPRTKQLIVNQHEATKVEAFFACAADGMLPRAIAAMANEQGWRTKRRVVKRTGAVTGGGPWTPRQILFLLQNPTYLGQLRDGRSTRPGPHRQIISQETWDLVHDRLGERRTTAPERKRQAMTGAYVVLRGKLRCPKCNRYLSPHQTRVGLITYLHYRCRSHAGGRPPCTGISFPAHELQKALIDILLAPRLINDLAPSDRPAGRRIQARLAAAEPHQRHHLLPEMIAEVTFDQDLTKLTVHLNLAFDPEIHRIHET